MARLAVTATLAGALAARVADASPPPLALQLGLDEGAVWAKQTGWLRDDVIGSLRGSLGLGEYVALDAGLAEDAERVEPAFVVGARVRPWPGACWRARFSPYARAAIAIVGASHLGSNYDLLVGGGHWGAIADAVPWLAWYAELDVVARVGEYDSWSVRVEAGIALHTARFWK